MVPEAAREAVTAISNVSPTAVTAAAVVLPGWASVLARVPPPAGSDWVLADPAGKTVAAILVAARASRAGVMDGARRVVSPRVVVTVAVAAVPPVPAGDARRPRAVVEDVGAVGALAQAATVVAAVGFRPEGRRPTIAGAAARAVTAAVVAVVVPSETTVDVASAGVIPSAGPMPPPNRRRAVDAGVVVAVAVAATAGAVRPGASSTRPTMAGGVAVPTSAVGASRAIGIVRPAGTEPVRVAARGC